MLEVGNTYIQSNVDDIIHELKNELALNGIKLFYKTIDTPRNTMICCPFHKNGQERKPSMGIQKETGICHCFACGWTGHISEMISNVFGYDDFGNYGSKWLIRNFLSLEVTTRDEIDLDCERKRNNRHGNNVDSILSLSYVDEQTLDSFRYNHPYWKKRGITDERIIELFDLGYDKKTDCITFPVRDVHGTCLFVARRSTKTKYFNYPKDVEKPLYGLYELQSVKNEIIIRQEIIVCESMLDALSFWQVGKYSVALNGTGTELQYKQLRQLPCRHIILATDMDSAGIKAKEELKKQLHNKIISEYMFPDGIKDANECLCKRKMTEIQEIFN